MTPFKTSALRMITQPGVPDCDLLEPNLFVLEGDNQIAIFPVALDYYQIVACACTSKEHVILLDDSFNTMPEAVARLGLFLTDEYAGA